MDFKMNISQDDIANVVANNEAAIVAKTKQVARAQEQVDAMNKQIEDERDEQVKNSKVLSTKFYTKIASDVYAQAVLAMSETMENGMSHLMVPNLIRKETKNTKGYVCVLTESKFCEVLIPHVFDFEPHAGYTLALLEGTTYSDKLETIINRKDKSGRIIRDNGMSNSMRKVINTPLFNYDPNVAVAERTPEDIISDNIDADWFGVDANYLAIRQYAVREVKRQFGRIGIKFLWSNEHKGEYDGLLFETVLQTLNYTLLALKEVEMTRDDSIVKLDDDRYRRDPSRYYIFNSSTIDKKKYTTVAQLVSAASRTAYNKYIDALRKDVRIGHQLKTQVQTFTNLLYKHEVDNSYGDGNIQGNVSELAINESISIGDMTRPYIKHLKCYGDVERVFMDDIVGIIRYYFGSRENYNIWKAARKGKQRGKGSWFTFYENFKEHHEDMWKILEKLSHDETTYLSMILNDESKPWNMWVPSDDSQKEIYKRNLIEELKENFTTMEYMVKKCADVKHRYYYSEELEDSLTTLRNAGGLDNIAIISKLPVEEVFNINKLVNEYIEAMRKIITVVEVCNCREVGMPTYRMVSAKVERKIAYYNTELKEHRHVTRTVAVRAPRKIKATPMTVERNRFTYITTWCGIDEKAKAKRAKLGRDGKFKLVNELIITPATPIKITDWSTNEPIELTVTKPWNIVSKIRENIFYTWLVSFKVHEQMSETFISFNGTVRDDLITIDDNWYVPRCVSRRPIAKDRVYKLERRVEKSAPFITLEQYREFANDERRMYWQGRGLVKVETIKEYNELDEK